MAYYHEDDDEIFDDMDYAERQITKRRIVIEVDDIMVEQIATALRALSSVKIIVE